jgi:hypothetical protein
MDLREAVLTQPMRRFQMVVVAICIALSMIDGYEVLVMAFVAPHLARAWGIGPVEVGYLLSAGIFGMALGATFISREQQKPWEMLRHRSRLYADLT